MDIKVGDRVHFGNTPEYHSGDGEVVAILNSDVPFPVVVRYEGTDHENYFTEDELEVIS